MTETCFATQQVQILIRPRLATSRNRVLRGAGATAAAKGTRGACRPRDGASKVSNCGADVGIYAEGSIARIAVAGCERSAGVGERGMQAEGRPGTWETSPPWSEWNTAPRAARVCRAISSAARTSSTVWRALMAQPTTLRLNTSSTVVKYKNPSWVGTYVRSATHGRFGSSAWNRRWTRSGATAARRRACVVERRRRVTPCRPCARNSACTRRAPYVPCDSAWIAAICRLNASLSCARRLGPRRRHA